MYTRIYELDSSKYPSSLDLIKTAVMTLNGVTDVDVANTRNSLVVYFDNPLSEKQILSTINQYKQKV